MTGETNWEQSSLCNVFAEVRFNQGPDYICYFYRPQTKFAKVMFLHLSVSYSVHGGVLPQCMLGYPRDQAPPEQTHTPPRSRHPPGAGTPPSSARWEIRSTRGRYASYWNAYLFLSSKFISISVLSWKNLRNLKGPMRRGIHFTTFITVSANLVKKSKKNNTTFCCSIYRSGTLNSNTVNSKFHLIRSFFQILARILSFHV